MATLNLCPGCGRPECDCTPADVRVQLTRDRASLSDRAAEYTTRANVAARLLRQAAEHVPADLRAEIEAWLAPVPPR